jgi:hypothetical protein
MTRNLHAGGYLSAVVADSRAAMPRLPGVAESDPRGPRELAAVPSRQSGSPKAEFVAANDIAARRQLGRPGHSHDRAAESGHEGADESVAPSTVPRDGATARGASLDLTVPEAEEGTASGDAAEPRGAFEAGSIAGNVREAGPELTVTTVPDFDSVQTAELVATGRRAGPHKTREAESRPLSSAAGERNAGDDALAATVPSAQAHAVGKNPSGRWDSDPQEAPAAYRPFARTHPSSAVGSTATSDAMAPSRDATQHQAALSDRERGTIPDSDAAVPLIPTSAQARSRQPDFVQTAQAVGKSAAGSTRTSEPAVLQERNDDASITDRAAESELRRAAEVRQTAARNITDSSYNLPVLSRRQSLEQRPSRVQPASARPEAEGIHIGTLDIRIEAPKQRLQPPSRQPVSFRGSGIASRLYLRRD